MILIAGCGYVGGRLAELLVEDGRPVAGLKRNASTVPDGVLGIAADVSEPATLDGLRGTMGEPVDALVYAVAPTGRSEGAYRTAYVDGLRNVLAALESSRPEPRRVLLVSSTGVYGQEDGRWVDEDSTAEPADATGRVVLEGEGLMGDLGGRGVVLRLGGIYGPGRTRTVRRVLSGEAGCPDPGSFGNRIHRDDAAGALLHLLDLPNPAPLYVGVDRDPAPLREVYRWVAEQGGVADPCEKGGYDGVGAAGRRGTNKRCSSRRLADSGYRFRYPTFREGYRPIVDELSG
jgi:nucleoside-diphosphate-sugar epimerase